MIYIFKTIYICVYICIYLDIVFIYIYIYVYTYSTYWRVFWIPSAQHQVPIIGWLQILVVIALSELWRYERPGDVSGDGENLGKSMETHGKSMENHGTNAGKPMNKTIGNDRIMLENDGKTENHGNTDD